MVAFCSIAAESGIVVWDCKDGEEVMLIPYGLFIAGDNPMQAEECSHTGLNCNYYCRTCDVGGTKEYKESKAGYSSIFNVRKSVLRFQTANFACVGRQYPHTRGDRKHGSRAIRHCSAIRSHITVTYFHIIRGNGRA
jgi:hypothetical protein